ncbi:MAG: YaiI/YqxD family protein [Pirellulaceae bacterium]|nr:YaiI/YqxD family protein [Pirellulaceae bacterium]
MWVDADACPAAIKDLLFRTVKRLEIELILIANTSIRVPNSPWVRSIAVPHGADVADDQIVDLMNSGDVVITADIPLAARVVEKSGTAIGPRGELFDEGTVYSKLASRNLMDQLRSAGMETSGPSPLSQKDVQAFANLLDRTLTRKMRRQA